MIKNTFTFIPGIGEITERRFWEKGFFTLADLKSPTHNIKLSRIKRETIKKYISNALAAINNLDASFFSKHLIKREYWRLYKEFYNKAIFLDIETTGLSLYYDKITIIGTFDGKVINFFIRDNNLNEFINFIKNYEIIVTFNGKLFDIPFIRKEFPKIKMPPIHIDLRYLLRSIDLTGPLKKIEKKLGYRRPKNLKDINGRQATILWSQFLKGNNKSLKKLLLYNMYDTINLQKLLHYCYYTKAKKIDKKLNSIPYQMKLTGETNNKKVDYNLPKINFKIPKIHIGEFKNKNITIFINNRSLEVNYKKINKNDIKINYFVKQIIKEGEIPVSIGIDLSGSENKASGICILKGKEAFLSIAKTDEEIINKTIKEKPTIISIDSPLGLPKGRCCPQDSCDCRIYGILRECERILKKRGINVYPCLIPSMQKLTIRGIKLSKIFKEYGYVVIESYPGAAQDILGLPRKRINLKELEIDLMNMGIKPHSKNKIISHDEIDALTSSLVGYFYLTGDYEGIGNSYEGFLIIPAINNDKNKIKEDF